jgi:predicted DNA-binding transcriptional regulator YafY
MNEIKCLDNYLRLKEMLEKGCKGNPEFFAKRLGVSKRTVKRYIRALRKKENMNIIFDRSNRVYYLELL